LRRRVPVTAAIGSLVGLVGYELATHDPSGAIPPVAIALSFYTLGRSADAHRRRFLAGLATILGLAVCAFVSTALHDSAAKSLSSWLILVVAPLAVGIVLQRRSVLSVRLAEAAAQLRAEQSLHAARATAEERNRVARDLHDVVAHCVSVMVVQAGAARLVAAQSPADADRALVVIGGCGRDALADLRRIVGVLHRDADADFGCGAGLADIDRLAERIDAAGVHTHVHLEEDAPLPPAVDVVAYQVVQEALTNVVKHAGAGASAEIRILSTSAELTLEVANTAGAKPPESLIHSGQGLVGMRERVGAYRGYVHSGPTSDGGYAVVARIPLQPVERDRGAASGLATHRLQQLWQTRPSWAANAAVVVGWLVAMEVEAAISSARRGPWIFNAAAVALLALAAARRRRSPLLFLLVVGVIAATLSGGLTSFDRSTVTGLYCLAVPLFTVAAWRARTSATIGFALWITAATGLAALRGTALGGIGGALAMGIVIWTAGRIWRVQRLLTRDLSETTARLAAERDRRAELAVISERIRIARQLHGLVARGVVAMVVQAEAARNLLGDEPAGAEAAIRMIEQTGRDALSQLRRILGILRSTSGSPAPRALAVPSAPSEPQPDEHPTRLPQHALA
jgi:signal transduction histidine kinase